MNKVWDHFTHTVYDLLKSSLNFCIDGSKHPHPQLDVLENIHVDLMTNGFKLPDFFRSMMLLTCLLRGWELTIIQTSMAQGTVLGVTWDLTKWTILQYWDTEQAKRLGHHSPSVRKLSTVKKYQGPPSFHS